MSVSSLQDSTYNLQVIQSQVNRQRIDEQTNRSDENSKQGANTAQASYKSAVEVVPKADVRGNEMAYQKASVEYMQDTKVPNSIQAYSSVLNQDKREAISQAMGISVYA